MSAERELRFMRAQFQKTEDQLEDCRAICDILKKERDELRERLIATEDALDDALAAVVEKADAGGMP